MRTAQAKSFSYFWFFILSQFIVLFLLTALVANACRWQLEQYFVQKSIQTFLTVLHTLKRESNVFLWLNKLDLNSGNW